MIFSRSGLAGTISGFLEGVGVPWPGQWLLAAAGAEISDLTLTVVLATAFSLTYLLGAWAQYLLGRYCWGFLQQFVTEQWQQKLQTFFYKYGQGAILWSRPIAIGNYVSIPAGICHMHQGKFLLYTFVGIWPWAFGMLYAGSLIGAYLDAAAFYLTIFAIVMGLIGGGIAAWRTLRNRQHNIAKRQPEDA